MSFSSARQEQAFLGIPANTPQLRDECFRIRYQVYCVERQFEQQDHNPGGMENDIYDDRSVHALMLHRASGVAVGTIRLVLHESGSRLGSLPFHAVCREPQAHDREFLPLTATAEVSRLAISKARSLEVCHAFAGSEDGLGEDGPGYLALHVPVALGLLKMAVEMAASRSIQYFCAVMERSLLKMLRVYGIHLTSLGPLVPYHGLRQPCYGHIRTMMAALKATRPDVWRLMRTMDASGVLGSLVAARANRRGERTVEGAGAT
ncbi:MAG: PEP-CTERM/exosortase system-associated acyltransferase [Steroidobacteraceae bacterium]